MELNTSLEEDGFYRRYCHLPLAWIDYDRSKDFVKNIVQLDINKMYFSTFINKNPYKLAPERVKIKTLSDEPGMYYIMARVKDAKTKELPIVQPNYKDTLATLEELLNSSSSTILPENGVIYLLHAIQPDKVKYSTYEYFMKNYEYSNFEILEIYKQKFTKERIFNGPYFKNHEHFINSFINKASEIKGRLSMEIKLDLAMMIGKMFPKPIITGHYKRDNYTWDPNLKLFNYDYSEIKNPKCEVNNRIYQVPYMYLILQNEVFSNFGKHFKNALHIGADSITLDKKYYDQNKEDFKISDAMGDFKYKEFYGYYAYSPKNYCFYNENRTIEKLIVSGLNKKSRDEILRTIDDFVLMKRLPLERSRSIESYLNKDRTYIKEVKEKVSTNNMYNYESLNVIPEKALILAPARTGKTTTILNHFQGKKVLHLFYNKVPQTQIEEKVSNMDNNHNYEVRTFDSWILQHYPGKSKNYSRMRQWFIANIDKMILEFKKYDHIIVDEFQSCYGLLAEIVILMKNNLDKILFLGDFDQQLEKVRRNLYKLTIKDFKDVQKLKLNVNYKTPQKIAEIAENYISTDVKYVSKNEGSLRYINVENKEELVEFIKNYKDNYTMMICRHKQLRDDLIHLTGANILSVSQSLSWDSESVLLIGSSKLNEIMDEYEQRLEIKNAIMRSTNKIDIVEVFK